MTKAPEAAYGWMSGKTHTVFGGGLQLLTHCGSRITLYGNELGEYWKPRTLADVDCFDCIEAPDSFWATGVWQ